MQRKILFSELFFCDTLNYQINITVSAGNTDAEKMKNVLTVKFCNGKLESGESSLATRE